MMQCLGIASRHSLRRRRVNRNESNSTSLLAGRRHDSSSCAQQLERRRTGEPSPSQCRGSGRLSWAVEFPAVVLASRPWWSNWGVVIRRQSDSSKSCVAIRGNLYRWRLRLLTWSSWCTRHPFTIRVAIGSIAIRQSMVNRPWVVVAVAMVRCYFWRQELAPLRDRIGHRDWLLEHLSSPATTYFAASLS